MSTKRLSRTVLEGGRHNGNKFERYQSNKTERAEMRQYISACIVDAEFAEEYEPPRRQPIYQGFTDKLSPVYRWLDKRVGKSWAKTRRLLKEKFDDRTLAGFHIVHQHMLSSIGTEIQEKEIDRSFHYYYIDKNNILRKSAFQSYRKPRYFMVNHEPLPKDKELEMMKWLSNRSLGFYKGVLFWYLPDSPADAHWGHNGLTFSSYRYYGTPDYKYPITLSRSSKCSKNDVNYFRSLPEWVRKALVK